MVAERAGASIGTVYRYFPDRIAVLQSLAARNLDRVVARSVAEVGNPAHPDWESALTEAFAIFVEGFRTEPGFRSLRLGDVLDLGPSETDRSFNSLVADSIMDALEDRFDIVDSPRTRVLFEAAITVCDALAARAFATDHQGDERYLEIGRETVYRMLKDELHAT
jgi:AcrR family transcriptional regulator